MWLTWAKRDMGHPGPEFLSSYLDGELRPAALQGIGEHLERCESCCVDLEGLRHAVTLLRSAPLVAPPRSFAVSPEALPIRAWWGVPGRMAQVAAAAAVVVLLLAAAPFFTGAGGLDSTAFPVQVGMDQQSPLVTSGGAGPEPALSLTSPGQAAGASTGVGGPASLEGIPGGGMALPWSLGLAAFAIAAAGLLWRRLLARR